MLMNGFTMSSDTRRGEGHHISVTGVALGADVHGPDSGKETACSVVKCGDVIHPAVNTKDTFAVDGVPDTAIESPVFPNECEPVCASVLEGLSHIAALGVCYSPGSKEASHDMLHSNDEKSLKIIESEPAGM